MKPQPWLAPLVPVYSALARAKNAAYNRGALTPRRLQSPVISVGNLSTGGGGKTPLVIALAQLLTGAGIAADVLSRGYGRTEAATERVRPDTGDAARRFGDEPVLIATAANVPVYVGRSRFAAGHLAERSSPAGKRVHLLDDGFQHRQLARGLDIVVLHRSDVTARLLPAGTLREPLTSLRRAHVVVLRDEDRELASAVARYLHPDARIWYVRRTLACEVLPGPALAFCGIARPEEFFRGLRAAGVELAATVAYPDHYRYTDGDLRRTVEHARRSGARHLVTTEKDEARLGAAAMKWLAASMPTAAAKLTVELLEPEAVLAATVALFPHA